MKKKIRIGLVPKILIGLAAGILLGSFAPLGVNRFVHTLSSLFTQYLGFFIPLMILAFVTMGIADISDGAGRLLVVTVLLAYGSTVIAGFGATTVAKALFPKFMNADNLAAISAAADRSLTPYISVSIPPMMDTMTAVVLAFMLGLGMSALKSKANNSVIYRFMSDYSAIIEKALKASVIPFLPLYICGTFANLTCSGMTFSLLSVLWKVYLVIIVLHIAYLTIQFSIAGLISKKNPFRLMRLQFTGYLTALGMQSSAATIPVNLECARAQGISQEIRSFTVPLCANIHMCGSMISMCCCTVALMLMKALPVSYGTVMPMVFLLGVAMVAAPGAPGGAVMTALPFLGMTGLGDASSQALMIALYITQDSFGTACNVSGDNALGQCVEFIDKRFIHRGGETGNAE